MEIRSDSLWQRLTPVMFLLPGMLIILSVVIYPVVSLVQNSLFRWNLLVGNRTFVGLGNYVSVLTDKVFLQSLLRTTYYTVGVVTVELGLGFLLALLFNRSFRGLGVLRTLLVTPMLVAPVAVGLIWRFMYEPSIGILNYLLSLVHLPAMHWINNTATALPAIALADIWQWTPFVFLIFLAGLQGIPENILEAAKMDGASNWRIVVEMQVPLLQRVILIVLLLRVIDSFKLFDLVYIITRGGPGNSTYLVTFYNYVVGFTQFRMGRASATAFLIMLIISILTTLLLRTILRGERV